MSEVKHNTPAVAELVFRRRSDKDCLSHDDYFPSSRVLPDVIDLSKEEASNLEFSHVRTSDGYKIWSDSTAVVPHTGEVFIGDDVFWDFQPGATRPTLIPRNRETTRKHPDHWQRSVGRCVGRDKTSITIIVRTTVPFGYNPDHFVPLPADASAKLRRDTVAATRQRIIDAKSMIGMLRRQLATDETMLKSLQANVEDK